jgi:hypothetical protein
VNKQFELGYVAQKDMNNGKAAVTTKQGLPAIVMPAVSPKEAVEAWEQYQDLKKEIATKDDIQKIGDKEFYKKSYWRKLATFFNLSVEVVEEKKEVFEQNIIFYFTCKATAPNGRFATGSGSCDLLEKGRKNTIHNARATAETRAFNRAVSNLVGGGEVSAEEVSEDSATEITRPQKSYTDDDGITHESVVKARQAPAGVVPDEHYCRIHNKLMKQRSGKNGIWYDHRWQVNSVWQQCTGIEKPDDAEAEEY